MGTAAESLRLPRMGTAAESLGERNTSRPAHLPKSKNWFRFSCLQKKQIAFAINLNKNLKGIRATKIRLKQF